VPDFVSHTFPYVQPDKAGELTTGVPDAEQARASAERKTGGRGIPSGATIVPKLGGIAHKGKTYLSHHIEAPTLNPLHVTRARTLRNRLAREIAAGVGCGACGVAASLFLKFAAQKTAAAEEFYQAGDFEAHRKLSESARMDVLYAREHAAREAKSRPRPSPPWLSAHADDEPEQHDEPEPEESEPAEGEAP
jgi:hypothetical protein